MRRSIWVLLSVAVVGCAVPQATRVGMPLKSPGDKRAAFAWAYESFRRGETQQALPVFTALADTYPELADYQLYFAGSIHMRLGQDDAAAAAFTRLLNEHPQSVTARAAALELGMLFQRVGRDDAARPLLESALTDPDPATVLGARFALAEADERRGEVTEAYAKFMAVRRSAPGSILGRSAKEHALALRAQHPELRPRGAARLDEARLLLLERDYVAAETAAARLLEQPGGLDPGEIARLRADALRGQGKLEAALTALWQLGDLYPQSPAAPAALFRMASILWNRDRDTAALRAFEEFLRRYPGHRRTSEALYAVGRIHDTAGRTQKAIDTFAGLIKRSPGSERVAEARWQIGWIHYLSRNWSAAATAFSALADRTRDPRERNRATYWRARALERAGHSGTARMLFQRIATGDPASYYAAWAQRRLEARHDEPLAQLPALAGGAATLMPEPVDPGPPPVDEPFHLGRWAELKAAAVHPLARGELAAIERAHNDAASLRYLLRAYQTVDGFAAALRLLHRLGERADLSVDERQRLLYPLAFWTVVRSEADANRLDPLLVEAVMRQESLFDPEARSPANAHGLMQLLPRTAKRVAAASGRPFDQTHVTRPEVNIQLGVLHLRTLLDRFNGDTLKALAAYNGGEAAVQKWERRGVGLAADEFVESISYRETRDYVKRVVATYRTYEQLYRSIGAH